MMIMERLSQLLVWEKCNAVIQGVLNECRCLTDFTSDRHGYNHASAIFVPKQ